MVKFALFRIPVMVDWWFWLATVLLGGGATAHAPEDWVLVAVWTAVVFISIVVHELGHAFAGRHFGATPSIRLHGFGGVTFLPGRHFSRPQHILVSAAGPAAGLLLGLAVFAVSRLSPDLPHLARQGVRDALYVNFFWTAINLLPIQPLDGGQILAQALGPQRQRAVSWLGGMVAAVLCVWALTAGSLFSAFMLAMLAYYNFQRQPVEGGVITP
jgi:stage IV sporulation protein FB